MKKTSKAPARKPAAKKLAAKKSSTQPKRKAAGQSELVATLTRLVDGQDKVIDRLAKLTAITQELVQAVGRLGEGVEVMLQELARIQPAQGESGNKSPSPLGEVVDVVVVDESETGDGEDGNDDEE
jgi:hypothetical protein